MVGQQAKPVEVPARGEELERPDPDVAHRNARENRARQQSLARDSLPGNYSCEGARRRDAQSRHRFAYDEFAQHWPERRPAVAAA